MHRVLSSILLVLLIDSSCLFAQKTSFDIEEIIQLFPREEGTLNERKTITWLQNLARSLNLPLEVSSVNPINGQAFSYSYNVEILVPGTSQDEVIYLTPLNNDNASLVPTILLLQNLATRDKPPTVGARFVFLGAEKGSGPAYPMGTKAFLQTYTPAQKSVFFYLDFSSTSAPNLWTTEEAPPALWPFEETKKLLEYVGIKTTFAAFSSIISRLPFTSEQIISLYNKENLTGIHLTSSISDTKRTLPPLLPWAQNIKTAFSLWHVNLQTVNITNEKNYVTFGTFIIPELTYVLFVIIFCLLMAAIVYGTKKILLSSYKYFWRHKRDFTLIFIVTFLCFFFSGLISVSFLVLKDNLDLWKENPFIFIFYKGLLFVPLYFIFLQFLRDINLSTIQKSSIRMALLLSINNSIILLFINVTFVWPILWSIVCLLVALIFPRPLIKTIAILLAPLFICTVLSPMFYTSNYVLAEFFLFDNLFANFILTMIFFPTTLTILALNFKNPYAVLQRNRILGILVSLFLISATYGIFTYKFYKKNHQPLYIKISENLDLNNMLIELSSPDKMGSFTLLVEGKEYPLEKVKRQLQIKSITENSLELKYRITPLYSTNTLELEITSKNSIESYEIIMTSTNELFVTNSNFPIEIIKREKGPANFTILTGKNPPNPLIVNLIVNQDSGIIFEVTAKTKSESNRVTTVPKRFDINVTEEVSKRIKIEK